MTFEVTRLIPCQSKHLEEGNRMTREFFVYLSVFLAVVASTVSSGRDLGTQRGRMWSPFVEWKLENHEFAGNPFDIIARVSFSHEGGDEVRSTEMFYDGEGIWRFRFTATRPGEWTFETSSSEAALDGHTGRITVDPHPDSRARGFLTHSGNRFAVQVGNDAHLEGYAFAVYMDGVKYLSRELEKWDDSRTRAYCAAARANGFEVVFFHVNNHWFKLGALAWDGHQSVDPDLDTFRLLDRVVTIAYENGCRVHFWAWGDESRKWTPIGVGGINGEADRRLQRYLAARLGPLPGWTMGYGFDLHEWTTNAELNAWARFLHEHFGWQHLLSARGEPLQGEGNIYSYDGFGRDVPITTSAHGPESFEEIVEDLEGHTTQPHLYEERHSYRRAGFDLDMDGTRRLLWWEVMAGGMGGFFGFYSRNTDASLGYPYPSPEQLRTHHSFWHQGNRFRLDLERAAGVDGGTRVLRNSDSDLWVIYREEADSIDIDLTNAPGELPAVAVDTKEVYREVELGLLGPRNQTIKLPHESDWAVAVGRF